MNLVALDKTKIAIYVDTNHTADVTNVVPISFLSSHDNVCSLEDKAIHIFILAVTMGTPSMQVRVNQINKYGEGKRCIFFWTSNL